MSDSAGLPQNVRNAFEQAIRFGLMSGEQYHYIATQLLTKSPCTLLVFGIGYDSSLWYECAGAQLTLVEDNPKYLTLAPAKARIVLYDFYSRVGNWINVPDPPPLLARPWDFILVDGPSGYDPRCPGRQFPITWARQLARNRIFVHDYERPWEREVCDSVLGPPVRVITPAGKRRGSLAAFEVDRFVDALVVGD